ncbi:MAG: aminotransferase class V-fold PLP-dependent enzyme [Holosporaceae bacterium]|jgi:cysteine desulfurase|nr:aminotransferase class V-fold PLP-dependent enzyme [Holosporaceae bacterium]
MERTQRRSEVIYLDYQATTPCDRRVLDEVIPYFCEEFGNPHSVNHIMGRTAKAAIETARSNVAELIGAESPEDIIFTSGATEANNLALQGIARFYREKGDRIIISEIEHKCVIEASRALERDGFDVIRIPVSRKGIVDLQVLEEALSDRTLLVSIMSVNNEIGTIQPIAEISEICKRHGVFFHTDAAQAAGKIELNAFQVDLMSISGHKIYGPKGIGALYVRKKPRIRLIPLLYGGGQERGLRSGTLPTPLCVGLGKACEIARQEMQSEAARLAQLKEYFLSVLFSNLEKVYLNGDVDSRCIPGCLNLSFAGVEGEAIMLGMPEICISSGSACTSETLQPSHVLRALSVREELAHSSLRIGFGRFTTLEEVKFASEKLVEVVNKLRQMSPLW